MKRAMAANAVKIGLIAAGIQLGVCGALSVRPITSGCSPELTLGRMLTTERWRSAFDAKVHLSAGVTAVLLTPLRSVNSWHPGCLGTFERTLNDGLDVRSGWLRNPDEGIALSGGTKPQMSLSLLVGWPVAWMVVEADDRWKANQTRALLPRIECAGVFLGWSGLRAIPASMLGSWALTAAGWLVVATFASECRAFMRRVKNQCSECGYSMKGISAGRCPECGAGLEPAMAPSGAE
jgi:hypothetical protein